MNELQIFNNEKFGEIRAVEIDGEPWVVGKDAASALGYKNTNDAITRHCKKARPYHCLTNRGMQELKIIPKSDIYRLTSRSKLKEAEQFKEWMFEKVLPPIEKHGGYIIGQESMTGEELLARGVQYADSKIKELESKVEVMTPKALFADAVSTSKKLPGKARSILLTNS